MLRSVKRLRHMRVQASDGKVGRVEQVFFDDICRRFRYLVVEVDKGLGGRCALILPPYWAGSGVPGTCGLSPLYLGTDGASDRESGAGTHDAHLRSSREVFGYHLRVGGTWIGRVDDFIFEESEWRILFIQAARTRCSSVKRGRFSTMWVESVEWGHREMVMDLPADAIRTDREWSWDGHAAD